MDLNESQSLDTEYKRHLEIMRPYLGQLLDEDIIEICNAWIKRLSKCKETEKVLRNKYVFALCYQLAKGILEEPFISNPSSEDSPLSPLPDEMNSDESTEVECLVLDLENTDIKLLYNNQKTILSATENLTLNSDLKSDHSKSDFLSESNKSLISKQHLKATCKQSILCYNCPEMSREYNPKDSIYQYRANNLIIKLREIKKQNLMLHHELQILREKYKIRNVCDDLRDDNLKVDNSTSVYLQRYESTTTLKSLKDKLYELQDSKNTLIETISNLQNKLDNINEINNSEKESIKTKHELDIIKIKSIVREETKASYEKKMEELAHHYEETIDGIKNEQLKELTKIEKCKDAVISEKDNIISIKDIEIAKLSNCIEDLKQNQISLLKKIIDNPQDEFSTNHVKIRPEELSKRLSKMEKSQIRFLKAYETKLSNLQQEKHAAECSLQLQLLKQRAQVVNDYTQEHQQELTTAVQKLEDKYKEIVANVQATAVQRRIQDQMALETIIQAVCGIRNEPVYTNTAQMTSNPSNLKPTIARRSHMGNGNQFCDSEPSTICRENKVGNVIVGNKSYGEECASGYCLDRQKLGALFERVHIPQRDTSEDKPIN